MKSLQEQLNEVRSALKISQVEQSKKDNDREGFVEEKVYKFCSVCQNVILLERLEKHIRMQHPSQFSIIDNSLFKECRIENGRFLVNCPTCDVLVEKNRLKRHVKRAHKKKKATNKTLQSNNNNNNLRKLRPLAKRALTDEEALDFRNVLKESLVKDPEILRYITEHPEKDTVGKFGLPQDKFRWGFYGSMSMVKDIWRLADKKR